MSTTRFLTMLVGVLCLGAPVAQPLAQPAILEGSILTHHGMCEASGAVALPRGSFGEHFAVANDEDNELRVYAADRNGRRTARFDFGRALRLSDKADLEAAAWLDDRIYWLGSHSRRGNGRRDDNRQRLFATVIRRGGTSPDLELARGTKAIDLLPALSRVEGLAASIGGSATDPELSPNRTGFNLEGLAAGPDGSLILAMRAPLLPDFRIVVVPLLNPGAAVEGAAIRLGRPIPLNLGGRGVRSIDLVESRGRYLIVAGPSADRAPAFTDGGPPYRLYSWGGKEGEEAVAIAGADAVMRDLFRREFTPEGMIVEASGDRIQLLSDDGELHSPGLRNCKDRPADRQEFRSAVLRIHW